MRKRVKDAYPYKSWSDKVDKMSDQQIWAITQRLNSIKKENKNEHQLGNECPDPIWVQGSLFD